MAEFQIRFSHTASGTTRGIVVGPETSMSGGHEKGLVFEPITLASAALWVLTYLAEGALEYIGGKIIAKIMGDPTLSDIADEIKWAVGALEEFIPIALKRAFTEHDLLLLSATADSITRNLRDYSKLTTKKDQQAYRYLLTDAHVTSSQAISLAAQYRQNGMIAYGQLVSLRIIAAIADYKLENATGSKAIVSDTVSEAKVNIGLWLKEFIDSWDPAGRVSQIHWDVRRIPARNEYEVSHDFWSSWCTKDGVRINLTSGLDQKPDLGPAYQAVVAQAQAERDKAVNTIAPPLTEAMDNWTKASEQLR